MHMLRLHMLATAHMVLTRSRHLGRRPQVLQGWACLDLKVGSLSGAFRKIATPGHTLINCGDNLRAFDNPDSVRLLVRPLISLLYLKLYLKFVSAYASTA